MKHCMIFVFSLLALSACNTIEGVGRDLGKAGNAISDTAGKTKERI